MIRSAESFDIKRILELSEALYSEDGEVPFDRVRASTAFRAMQDDKGLGTVLVAVEYGAVVGLLVLVWGFSFESGGRDAFVDELYVVPDWRGRGIGTAMIEAAEAECVRRGASALHLVAEVSNVDARRLYGRLGFSGREVALLTKRLP